MTDTEMDNLTELVQLETAACVLPPCFTVQVHHDETMLYMRVECDIVTREEGQTVGLMAATPLANLLGMAPVMLTEHTRGTVYQACLGIIATMKAMTENPS